MKGRINTRGLSGRDEFPDALQDHVPGPLMKGRRVNEEGVKARQRAIGEILERFTLYLGWSFLCLNYDGSAARCQDDTSPLSFCICSIISADSF